MKDCIPTKETEDYVQKDAPDAVIAVEEKMYDLVDQAFSKCLAATIMSNFPIACIFAIFWGHKGLKLAKQASDFAQLHGIKKGGKHLAATILGNVGKWHGLYITILWAYICSIILLYWLIFLAEVFFAFIIFAFIIGVGLALLNYINS